MRILQVGKYYHPDKGGIESHLRVLAKHLQPKAAVAVTVAGQHRSGIDFIDGVLIERLAVTATVFGAPVCAGLIDKLRTTDSDIVHIHLPNPWAVMAYLISGCRSSLVVTYHSDIVRQSFVEPVFRPLLLKFLERSSAIICSSPNLIQHSRILNRFQNLCKVVPFGIEMQSLHQANATQVQSIIANYPKPIILSVGRLVYYKGFEYLIRAMTQVNASLIIIGKGPRKKGLLRLASKLGISDRVTILADVEDVAPFYHASKLFVLPSIARSEAFGIVQLEAMAACKPVVNTQLKSGVPFVSQHGITGLTVPPADSLALSAAINRLLGNANLRAEYGAAARIRAEQEFTVSKMVSQTLKIYDDVLAARNKPVAQELVEKTSAAYN